MADELVTQLKHLWANDDPVDFEGEHYQCYDGYVAPKPVRKPRPILMNAGQSDTGFDFACRQADWVFVAPPKGRHRKRAQQRLIVVALDGRFG